MKYPVLHDILDSLIVTLAIYLLFSLWSCKSKQTITTTSSVLNSATYAAHQQHINDTLAMRICVYDPTTIDPSLLEWPTDSPRPALSLPRFPGSAKIIDILSTRNTSITDSSQVSQSSNAKSTQTQVEQKSPSNHVWGTSKIWLVLIFTLIIAVTTQVALRSSHK